MAYSTPRTWTTGELATAAMLNQDVRDNVSFLANPPACRVYHNTTQSVGNNAEMSVAFNSETYDTNAMHDPVTNNSRITIQTAGIYLVTWSLFLGVDTDYTLFYSYLRKNGAGIHTLGSEVGTQPDANTGPMSVGSTTDKFIVGDYLEVRANQKNTSAGANLLQATNCVFTATWIGLG